MRLCFPWLKFAAACSLVAAVLSGQESPKPDDSLVELPTLTVDAQRDLPPRESWRYATAPGVEVLSNGSDHVSKKLVKDLFEFQSLVDVMFPALARTRDEMPIALVLCDSDKSFNQFLPEVDWYVRDHTESFVGRTDDSLVLGAYVRLGEREVDETIAQPAETEEGANPASAGVVAADPFAGVKRAYFSFLFKRAVGAPPPWLESGVSRLLGSVERTQRGFTVGKIGSFNGGPADDFQALFAVARRAMQPLEKLFTQPKPEAQENLAAWEMQAYAFVHKCMLDGRGKYQPAFIAFAERAAHEPVTEVMFKECFGRTFAQMDKDLWAYVNATSFKHMQLTLPKDRQLPKPPEIDFAAASDADAGRLKSKAFRANGVSDKAYNQLLAPYVRGERDPELLAALGVAQYERNQREKARKLLESAWKEKAGGSTALITLARLRLDEALAKPAAPDGKHLGKKQVIDVLTPLFAAHAKPPAQAELYVLIAETWRESAQPPTPANLEVVAEGVNRFSRHVPLVLAAAEVYARHGFLNEAAILAQGGLKIAKDDQRAAQRFTEILKTAKSPAAPAGM